MMTLREYLNQRTQAWRSQAAALRERYKGMGDLGHPGRTAADTLEACAKEIEEALAAIVPKAGGSAGQQAREEGGA